MRFVQTRDVGYRRDQIVAIPLNKEIRRGFDGFRAELLRSPAVENAATSDFVPTVGRAYSPLDFEGGEEGQTQVVYAVDKDFAATYGLQLLTGRWIARTPAVAGFSEMLISELSARRAGYASPRDAIGKRVDITTPEGRDSAQIVGVVKDILIASLHRPPDPLVYLAAPIDRHEFISLRIRGDRAAEALALLQRTWRRMAPSYPLDYFFLDDSFAQLHQAERRMSRLFVVFSGLAIAIACLGLFGLAAHMAERRTKEIGIRKILGASTPALYVCLSRDLLKWVALANVFAWPIAFTVMQIWLRNFAFRISIGWWVFPLGAGLALVVAAMTVGSQTLRAVRHDPVASLRYE
jgi:putative ABC transport system permease protein